MTVQDAYQQLFYQLIEIYDASEAQVIANWVVEDLTGFTKIDRVQNKTALVSKEQIAQLESIAVLLLQHQPVQQVLGYAWFYREKFRVNNQVLIPRPETEELVDWIIQENKHLVGLDILEVGTGSGCIAISLQKKLKESNVLALDISEEALAIAKHNNHSLDAKVEFIQLDFLTQHSQLNKTFHILVSNPPYIKKTEAAQMHKNVLAYEPSIALFVEDDDALIFYKAIAQFAQKHLSDTGSIYVEINEQLGAATCACFESYGFSTNLKKDLQGKDRMIKATKL